MLIGGTSCYCLFRGLFDRLTGLVVASIFVTFTFSHSIGGADYHTEISGALFALTWYLAFRAATVSANSAVSIFLIGFAGALSVHSYILFANLAPYILANWYLTSRQLAERSPPVVRFIVVGAMGALACTVVLGLINKLAGRDFGFFLQQFRIVRSFVADSTNQLSWWHSWSTGFYWERGYFGLFVAGTVAALVIAVLNVSAAKQSQESAQRVFLAIAYLASFAFWIAWQTAGQTALDFDYFAYPLLLPLLGLLAACVPSIRQLTDAWSWPSNTMIYALIASGLLLPLFGGMSFWNFFINQGYSRLAIAAMLLSASTFAWLLVRPRVLAFTLGVPLLGVTSLVTTPTPQLFVYSPCTTARDWQSIILQSHELIYSLHPNDITAKIWFDNDSTNPSATEFVTDECSGAKLDYASFGFSLVSTGFSYLTLNPWRVRGPDDLDDTELIAMRQANSLVAYVTADAKRLAGLQARFARAGVIISPSATYQIRSGSSVLPITVFKFSDQTVAK